MDSASLLVSITAIVAAIGVAIKQILDLREIKRWICYKHPCDTRITTTPDDIT